MTPTLHRPLLSGRVVTILTLCASALVLTACAKPPRDALAQEGNLGGKKQSFGGRYVLSGTEANTLTLTIGGEPAMRGKFPPYTPTLSLNGDYKGTAVRAECYFASRLTEMGGIRGVIAGAVQSGQGKSGDTCKMMAGETQLAILNF